MVKEAGFPISNSYLLPRSPLTVMILNPLAASLVLIDQYRSFLDSPFRKIFINYRLKDLQNLASFRKLQIKMLDSWALSPFLIKMSVSYVKKKKDLKLQIYINLTTFSGTNKTCVEVKCSSQCPFFKPYRE